MPFIDEWVDKVNNVDEQSAEDVNLLAGGIKEALGKIPTKTSQLENDKKYATRDELPKVPTKVSELKNDSGYLSEIPEEYITEDELAEKGYITKIPEEYAKKNDLISVIQDFNEQLITNSVYKYTATDSIHIPVPVSADGTPINTSKQNKVLLYIKTTALQVVSWDEGLQFVNDEIPTIDLGCYRINLEYNPLAEAWIVDVVRDEVQPQTIREISSANLSNLMYDANFSNIQCESLPNTTNLGYIYLSFYDVNDYYPYCYDHNKNSLEIVGSVGGARRGIRINPQNYTKDTYIFKGGIKKVSTGKVVQTFTITYTKVD